MKISSFLRAFSLKSNLLLLLMFSSIFALPFFGIKWRRLSCYDIERSLEIKILRASAQELANFVKNIREEVVIFDFLSKEQNEKIALERFLSFAKTKVEVYRKRIGQKRDYDALKRGYWQFLGTIILSSFSYFLYYCNQCRAQNLEELKLEAMQQGACLITTNGFACGFGYVDKSYLKEKTAQAAALSYNGHGDIFWGVSALILGLFSINSFYSFYKPCNKEYFQKWSLFKEKVEEALKECSQKEAVVVW